MPKIPIPDGPEPIHKRALSMRPEFWEPWRAMLYAVHDDSVLSTRIREAARYRIALANGCLICQSARNLGLREGEEPLSDDFYAEVERHGESAVLSAREKLAAEFADRFALDHESMDDAFFARLSAEFSDEEIVDLAFCTGRNLGFGRMTRVLGLDDSCELPHADGVRADGLPA